MAIWKDRPDDGNRPTSYDLIRTPTKGTVSGIVVSSKVVGAVTHFWKGRTVTCSEADCEACKAGREPRWYGHLGLWTCNYKRVVIVEFTPTAEPAIHQYFLEHGTLRGARLTMRRQGERINGKLQVVIEEGTFAATRLPDEFDVRAVLMRMWEVNERYLPATDEGRVDLTIVDEQTRRKILDKDRDEEDGDEVAA